MSGWLDSPAVSGSRQRVSKRHRSGWIGCSDDQNVNIGRRGPRPAEGSMRPGPEDCGGLDSADVLKRCFQQRDWAEGDLQQLT